MPDIERFEAFLYEIAGGDEWEYENGDQMAEDAHAFIESRQLCIEACWAALWELGGHLEHGTAMPILKTALRTTQEERVEEANND